METITQKINKTTNFIGKINSKDIKRIKKEFNSKNKGKALKLITEIKRNLQKISIFKKYRQIINFMLFEIVLLILPKEILSADNYIELKVGKTGYQQIISDKFDQSKFPWVIYVNNEVQILRENRVNVESINYKIKLMWERTLSDFRYIFYNLTNITSIYMYNIFGSNSDMSYLCYNCINLVNFTYNSVYYPIYITNMEYMFYNCLSLKSFNFDYFQFNYEYVKMSYMFYNCQSLISLSYDYILQYAGDMIGMFYNCISLESISLKFYTSSYNYIDFSFVFYNCTKLEQISITNVYYGKNMSYAFSNCRSLRNISLDNFKSCYNDNSDCFINMSNLFSNCHNLNSVSGNLNNLYISDTSQMFFNCFNLNSIASQLYIYGNNNHINMSNMFYNCSNINSISIYGAKYSGNYYYSNKIYSNDLNKMFYNCISLKSIYFTYFHISYVKDMSYMFFNCKQMIIFMQIIVS